MFYVEELETLSGCEHKAKDITDTIDRLEERDVEKR